MLSVLRFLASVAWVIGIVALFVDRGFAVDVLVVAAVLSFAAGVVVGEQRHEELVAILRGEDTRKLN